MADITYPNGNRTFQTLISAATPSTTATDTQGTIELSSGDGVTLGHPNVTGVLLNVDYTHGTSDRTALTVLVQTSADGTNWFEADQNTFAIASGLGTALTSYVIPVQSLAPAENKLRVQVTVGGGTNSGTSAITVKARLMGTYLPSY